MLDHFWKTEERTLKATLLLLKGSRIYKGQAFELHPQNEILKACKERNLLKTFLAVKSEIDELYRSSTDDDSEASKEDEDKEKRNHSPAGSQWFFFFLCNFPYFVCSFC